MSLLFEIEYLSGVCFAAIGPDSDVPDWPPQPDRIFSALVATWGARGEDDHEGRALEWLEAQATPIIEASGAFPRTAPTSFVPPNDPETGRSGTASVMPTLRPRQGRRFAAARPGAPVMRLRWMNAVPDEKTLTFLQRLASDTAYVGHSASLTRCRFRRSDTSPPADARQADRGVYPGRLAELRRSYEVFVASGGRKGRPLQGARVRVQKREPAAPYPGAFGSHCLILEHVDGEMPDIRAAGVVARAIRDALLSGYKRIGLEDRIPEVVSGHAADGTPTRRPHLAIVPLPFAGFPHADGHVLGFAVVPPVDSDILDDVDFRRALRRLSPVDEERGRRVLTVKSRVGASPEAAFSVDLSPTFEPPFDRRSLDITLYSTPARTFGTVTPIVLDRHLKERGEAQAHEVRMQIVGMCRNLGLPEPREVVSDKHSAFEGAPSARASANSPAWMQWRVPPSLSSRRLTHAVVQFEEPVLGPLLLGAGRFVGLGLCRPLDVRG